MSLSSERAISFVNHLYDNPALRHYTPLQREEQIIHFLDKNAHTLAPTLGSPNFFPGLSWEQIAGALLNTLQEKIDALFLTDIRNVITHSINYSFLQGLGAIGVNYDVVQQQLEEAITKVLQVPYARRLLNGCYNAVRYNMPSRYISVAYIRKSYIYFEFTKVQKIQLSPDQLSDLIKVTVLLVPLIWLNSSASVSVNMNRTATEIDPSRVERVFAHARTEFGAIPENIMRSALRANLTFGDYSDLEASSRLSVIFVARGRYHNPQAVVERGADSPDKSWFSIARRNHKFYGYDSKMLEEFYSIAADNQW